MLHSTRMNNIDQRLWTLTLPPLFSAELNGLILHSPDFLKSLPTIINNSDPETIPIDENNCDDYSIIILLRASNFLVRSYSAIATYLQLGLVVSTIVYDTHYFVTSDHGKVILKRLLHKLSAQNFLNFLRDVEMERGSIKNAVGWVPSDQWAAILSIMTEKDENLKTQILGNLAQIDDIIEYTET